MLGPVLVEDIWGFFLVFARIGAMLMMIPALGSSSIPARFRLVLALAFSFLTYGFLRGSLPDMPDTPFALMVILFLEITKGIFVALLARLVLSALHVSGTIIGFQGGLAAAQQFDPNQGSQGAVVANFLTFIGLLIIFTADLHHLIIRSMVGSYDLFPVGASIVWGDIAEVGTQTVAGSFALGIQLAAPFLVYGLIYNISLGIIARLMPQLPVFFVGMPLNIFMGFFILSLVIGTMMLWFAGYFENTMRTLLPPA